MTTLTDISIQTITDKYSAEELARALLGAMELIMAMRCPHCGYIMEATVESTTETSGEQSSRGTDEVER